MKKRLLFVVLAALPGIAYLMLPSRAQLLPGGDDGAMFPRGAIHIHTRESDGGGTVDDVAAAAARAGLSFVVVTDHGDGTRAPFAPAYRSGVLCIDAIEISVDNGHVVALDLAAAPYRLGGEARDVVADLHRLGAFAIAAHPDSEKDALRWQDWQVPVDGVEWLNGDSEWRDEGIPTLLRTVLAYPWRQPEALGLVLDRPARTLERWDALSRTRRIVGLAAADAHARLGLESGEERYDAAASIRLPDYEQVFRTFSITLPQLRLSGDAGVDARAVIDEIRRGHVYSSIDAMARPARLTFTAGHTSGLAHAGDVLEVDGEITWTAETNAPSGWDVRVLKDGAVVRSSRESRLTFSTGPESAAYRVEVHAPDAAEGSVPWIVSNPIYVGARENADTTTAPVPASETASAYVDGQPTGWTIENSARSRAALDVVAANEGTQLLWRFALGGTRSESPFVALVMPVTRDLGTFDRIRFTAHADKPMRISLQLRSKSSEDRWQRSIYLDQTTQDVTIAFDDMRAAGETRRAAAALSDVGSVLFVVDSVNTPLGRNGQIWIDDVAFLR